MTEEELQAWLILTYSVDTGKMPETYTMDFWVGHGGQMLGYAELKGRKNASSAFRGVTMFDASKWYACIEHEKRTGTPALLIVGFNDRIVAGVQPAAYGPVEDTGMSTPGAKSGSHNKGWQRPVVRVPLERMAILGRVPGDITPYLHPQKPPKVEQTSLRNKFDWVREIDRLSVAREVSLIRALEDHSGITLGRMPHVHPLSHFIWKEERLMGFVGISRPLPVPEGFAVDADSWFAALEHEEVFAGTQAYLSTASADGKGLIVRPSKVTGSVTSRSVYLEGSPLSRRMMVIPEEVFSPIGSTV